MGLFWTIEHGVSHCDGVQCYRGAGCCCRYQRPLVLSQHVLRTRKGVPFQQYARPPITMHPTSLLFNRSREALGPSVIGRPLCGRQRRHINYRGKWLAGFFFSSVLLVWPKTSTISRLPSRADLKLHWRYSRRVLVEHGRVGRVPWFVAQRRAHGLG